MFRSLLFARLGMPLVAHVQWVEGASTGQLWVCADEQQVRKLANTLKVDEQSALLALLPKSGIPSALGGEAIFIDGGVALSLGHSICTLHDTVQSYQFPTGDPELYGFLEPPGNWEARVSQGILVWFEPDNGFQVAIVRSKQQAISILRELLFLEPERSDDLIKKVGKWNLLQKSSQPVQKIEGQVAELFCKGVVITRMSLAQANSHATRRAGAH